MEQLTFFLYRPKIKSIILQVQTFVFCFDSMEVHQPNILNAHPVTTLLHLSTVLLWLCHLIIVRQSREQPHSDVVVVPLVSSQIDYNELIMCLY